MLTEPVFESLDCMTPDEFEAWCERHGELVGRAELLNGRIVMTPPAGYPHGSVEVRIGAALVRYLEQHPVGIAFGSSQGFALPSGDTVEPDLAFVSGERWRQGPPPVEGKFLKVVPDLVVEILSHSTASRDRGEKKAIYAKNGVREYWLVDARSGRITRFDRAGDGWDLGTAFESDETLVSQVLPGLSIPVAPLFAAPLP